MIGFEAPNWDTDGRGWPLRSASAFHEAGGLRWHVQTVGTGPVCLLVHGTGASTHSWRGLVPLLASRFTVVSVDLPGHGFTSMPRPGGLGLDEMACKLGVLLAVLGIEPAMVVAHSAGAAIALRLALDRTIDPAGVVGLNGALRPFRGPAGPLYSIAAKALFLNPLAPRIFAMGADRRRVARLIENTGSTLDDHGLELYRRLFRRSGHVAGALGMMASWDLTRLLRDLPRLSAKLLLVVGEGDRAVPPSVSREVLPLVPGATLVAIKRLGHLAHEEDPAAVVRIIEEFARGCRVLTAAEPVAG